MWLVLYVVLWILNILCVSSNRSNRLISLLSYLYMAILFILNSGTAGDAYKYKIDFENFAFDDSWSELGYGLFKNALRMGGITTYNGLLFGLFIMASVFLLLGIRYFHSSYNTVFAVIMPFIFPTCAVAIRFFVVVGILVFSLRFLINRQVIPYILCVILATLFHRTALFYLIFLICTSDRINAVDNVKKIGIKIVVFFSLISVFLTYISGKVPFIGVAISFVSSVFGGMDIKIEAYTASMTKLGAVMFLCIYVVGLSYASYMRKLITSERDMGYVAYKQMLEFANVNYYIQLLMSITMPFIVINLVYYRLLMIGFISNAILYGMFISSRGKTKSVGTLRIDRSNILFLATCVVWLIPEYIGINSITIQGLIDASVLFK